MGVWMVNSFQFPRALIVYAIAVPLALILGFFLIAPESGLTWMLVGLLMFIAVLPWILKNHHTALVIGWGAFVNAFFLPGQPPLWLPLAALSLGISLLAAIIRGKRPFISVPLITRPLIFLTVIIVITAFSRGGIGARSLGGDSYGGKSYLMLLGAILGYFALTAQVITKRQAATLAGLYFLSSLTSLFSNIAYALGPAFYFLFHLFPAELVMNQVLQDYGGNLSGLDRIVGVSFACTGLYSFLLIRYGIRGLLDVSKPWRLLLLIVSVVGVLFGGFRSMVVWFGLLFAVQFFLERLHKTRYLFVFLATGILGAAVVFGAANKMPLTVQRAFSFLPIDIDPAAKKDALGSTEWRIEMWRALQPEIPEYFWLGKGYSIDPTDLYLAQESVRRGIAQDYEPHMIVGNYHSGPLSTIIPLGIEGVIGFLWLCTAGTIALYRNYKHGAPELTRINTFLLTWFACRIFFFIFIFGALNYELFFFTGILGLSISINGGVRRSPKRLSAVPQHQNSGATLLPATA
ncbi:MAG: hypothetical protein ACXWKH_06430 [Limisphaerales bacterium]